MNIEELIKLKEEIQTKYDEEKKQYDKTLVEKDKIIISEELKDISYELSKILKLIEIYKTNQPIELIEAKLENLYIQLISEIDDNEFNALDQDKLFELFEKYFPNDWVYINDINQKEGLLLDAICSNQMLKTTANTKSLDNPNGEF